MADKFQDKYRIPSARAGWWDYGNDAAYFVTINADNLKNHYFGHIRDDEMQLSAIGQIARDYWLEIPNNFPFVKQDVFVIMPNHVHGIIIINKMENAVETGLNVPTRNVTSRPDVETRLNAQTGHVETRLIASLPPPNQPPPEPPPHVPPRNITSRPDVKTRLIASLPPPNQPPPEQPNDVQARFIASIPEPPNDVQTRLNAQTGHIETRLIASLPPPPPEQSPQQQPKNKPGGITGKHNPMLGTGLGRIIRWYKGRVTFESRKIDPLFAWQARYYDHIIRNDESYQRIKKYIINNPANWPDDKFYSA